MNATHDGKMTACPVCGAALPNRGIIVPDRAGDTSQRCGKTPADSFFERFTLGGDSPEVMTIPELAARLSSSGVRGNLNEIEFLLTIINYRTISKFARTIGNRVSSSAVHVENIHTFVMFDRAVQAVMLHGIGMFEVRFRATLANVLSEAYGAFAHHDPDNFTSREFFDSFLSDYARELSYKVNSKKAVNVEDFERFGDVPVWQAVEILPLGTLSKMFRNIKDREMRKRIASAFDVKYVYLTSWLRTICEIRNRCAHFEDVCATPLICRPKKIEGISAPNTTAFYACLVINALIEGGIGTVTNREMLTHVSTFANSLMTMNGNVDREVFLAAGFPLNWVKQLSLVSPHMKIRT